MACPLNIAYPGACYHITIRVSEQKNISYRIDERENSFKYPETAKLKYCTHKQQKRKMGGN